MQSLKDIRLWLYKVMMAVPRLIGQKFMFSNVDRGETSGLYSIMVISATSGCGTTKSCD